MKVAAQDINYQFWANAYNTGISFALFVVLADFLAPIGVWSLCVGNSRGGDPLYVGSGRLC